MTKETRDALHHLIGHATSRPLTTAEANILHTAIALIDALWAEHLERRPTPPADTPGRDHGPSPSRCTDCDDGGR